MRKSLQETPLLKTRILPIALLFLLCGGGPLAQTPKPPEGGATNLPDGQTTAGPGKRTALIIGNSAYAQAPLKNPVNDAKAMAKALRECRFDVILKTDCNLEQMEAAVSDFGKRIRAGGEAALFYYAGHGIQVDGRNYLVPVGVDVDAENKVKYRCLDSGLALAEMENAANRVSIVILDACRNNPFARSWRSSSRGLAVMEAATGTVIAYSTAPGKLAADGDGDNSVYTQSLLKHLRTPVSILDVFTNVRRDVTAATKKAQTPWEATSLTGKFYFVKPGGPILPEVTPVPTPAGPSELENELASLREKEKMKGKAQESYGTLAGMEKETATTRAEADKRLRLWKLYVQEYGSAEYQIAEAEQKVSFYEKWTAPSEPSALSTPSMPSTPGAKKQPMTVDLGGGVKMDLVWVPAGAFQMGSPDSEAGRSSDEGPVHAVELDGFWMGKYEVTQEQYEAVMGKNPSNFKGAKNPVKCVSWNDATDFCRKLTDKVGQASPPVSSGRSFRLPTEAEWEYACRAGSTTRFCFGDSDSGLEDYAWYDGNSGEHTHPVREKKPNAWGLYDMHGNVWEWCGDWYDKYGAGSAKNPQGGSSGEARVLRGGSWGCRPLFCRSAIRIRNYPTDSFDTNGFRAVCGGSSSR